MRCRHAWTVWACASAFFGPLASVVRCGEADPSSLTFVRDPGAEECLELRPDGTLFWNHYGDFTRGRYTKDGGAYACEADDGWRVRLQPTRRGWVGGAGDSWSVRGAPPAIPWRDLRPVTFVVCETGTGQRAQRVVENVTSRPPMFLVHVWPAGDGPASWGAPDWEELDDRRRLVVEDLQPGRYALSLLDWLGSRGFSDGVLIETEVEVRSRGEPLRLRLGAGCISGGLRWDGEYDEMIEVIAVGARTKTLRRARCDAGGNFGARYLQEDTYTLLAHDDSAGWCRVDDVIVRDDSTDVGLHALRPGGTIRGNVVVPIDLRWEASVVAVDSRSIPFEIWLRNGPGAQPFSISSLWPDTWTVSLRRGAEVVATRSVTIRGLETVDCDFP